MSSDKSEQLEKRAYAMWNSGATAQEVAKELRVSKGTVLAIILERERTGNS